MMRVGNTLFGCYALLAVGVTTAALAVTEIASAQQIPAVVRSRIPCNAAGTAAGRLICSDADLAGVNSILSLALQDSEKAASPEDRKLLLKEQLTWKQERNEKCSLTGKDHAPLDELQLAKQCLEDAIEDRISELQDGDQTGATNSSAPVPNSLNVIITPVAQSSVSVGPGGSQFSEFPSFQELHFSAPANGVGGLIDCNAIPAQDVGSALVNTPYDKKFVVKIAIDDDDNSYRMFESDGWTSFLNDLRDIVHTSCASAIKSGRLRNATNEQITELNDVFEVSSSQGLFVAYSVGQNSPWVLQINLPKARKVVKSDLGIQTWIRPSQLTKNPYFFKGSVVGMVIQFDHMLSANQAIFQQSGDEIFVSGVAPNLFQSKDLVVLAGRVSGNKGLISSTGSEALLPALEYVGTYKCGDRCEGF
jgi:uncharacterized protein YecT (DUF1311 family)